MRDDALAEVRILAITHSGLAHAPARAHPRLRDPQPLEVIPRVNLERVAELVERSRDTRIDGARRPAIHVSAFTLERFAQLLEVVFRDSRFTRLGVDDFSPPLDTSLDTTLKPPRVRRSAFKWCRGVEVVELSGENTKTGLLFSVYF